MKVPCISAYVPYVSSVSSYIPKIRIASRDQIIKNLSKMALPAITLVGMSMMYQAQAISKTECLANCDRHRDASELAKLICQALCIFFGED